MSLYIGNDNTGRGVIHLTNQVESMAAMKSGPTSSTVFHNDHTYSTWTRYNKAPASSGVSTSWILAFWQSSSWSFNLNGYGAPSNGSTRYLHTFPGLPALNPNSEFIMVDSNNNVVDANTSLWWYHPPGGVIGTSDTAVSHEPYGSTLVSVNTSSHPVAAIILINQGTVQAGGNSVEIGNGAIRLGGNNILNFKYMYNGGVINDHPSSITLGGGAQQLIDASAISGSLAISSVDGVSMISKGGYPIISSAGGFASTPAVYTYNNQQGSGYSPSVLPYIAQEGSLIHVDISSQGSVSSVVSYNQTHYVVNIDSYYFRHIVKVVFTAGGTQVWNYIEPNNSGLISYSFQNLIYNVTLRVHAPL